MRYEVKGEPMGVVICHVEDGEKMITESGSMVWMSPNMEMTTSAGGSFGKMLGRMFSGEKIFQNIYTAHGSGMIAFASSFPGSIRAVEVTPEHPLICQKSAFLAATEGVELSVFFQKKLGSALFSGEGFIMQKVSGRGTVFLEIDGSAVEYDLQPGQKLVVDTGNLASCDETCGIDVTTVKGAKNMLFGGEGIFHTVVTGPGHVVLQTMSMNEFIGMVASRIPTQGSSN